MKCSLPVFAKLCAVALFVYVVTSLQEWWLLRDYRRENDRIHKSRVESIDSIPYPIPINFEELNCNNKKSKETNIAFLKTHKAASSTVTSILNRFADVNDLGIALPRFNNMFNWPNGFNNKDVDYLRLKKGKVNILCNHAVYNRIELYKVFREPFKLLTILRHPVAHMYSAFHYGNLTRAYRLQNFSDPVAEFLKQPAKYFRKFESRMSRSLFEKELLISNGQTYDLNYQRFEKRRRNNTFDDFLRYIDNTFHLVLITEFFDEGLVLLRKLLCWNYMDFVYQKKLVNAKLRAQPSDDVRAKIHEWNKLDTRLYSYFKNRFVDIMNKLNGEQFEEDVFKFTTLNKLVSQYCLHYKNKSISLEYKSNVMDFLYEIREEVDPLFANQPDCFCKKLAKSEVNYLRYFERKFPLFSRFEKNAKFNDC